MSFPLNVRDVFGNRLSPAGSREGMFRGFGHATVTVAHVGQVQLSLMANVQNAIGFPYKWVIVYAKLAGPINVVSCKVAIFDSAADKFVSKKCVIKKGDNDMVLIQIISRPEDNVRQDGEWTDEGDAWLKTFTVCVTDVVADGLFWML